MNIDIKQEDIWNDAAARNYDASNAGMFASDVIESTVARLMELADGGRVLEFAIGTGRIAIPLARRGVSVTGIELSKPMIDQLRMKIDEASLQIGTAPHSQQIQVLIFLYIG